MDALVAAAKKEGTLNVIALPPDWANYAAIIARFKAQVRHQGQQREPRRLERRRDQRAEVDQGPGQRAGRRRRRQLLRAPRRAGRPVRAVQGRDLGRHPGRARRTPAASGSATTAATSRSAATPPRSGPARRRSSDLDNPAYKGLVALNGDPTSANAAFEAVWAAALANGGSADDIQPGIDFFKKLNCEGIFNKTKVTPATVASGATPIVLDWDYLNAGEVDALKAKSVTWKVADPTDGLVSGYYAQAISLNAPHPAAARLWEEFLYSQKPTDGQNGWLKRLRPADRARGDAEGRHGGQDGARDGPAGRPTPTRSTRRRTRSPRPRPWSRRTGRAAVS